MFESVGMVNQWKLRPPLLILVKKWCYFCKDHGLSPSHSCPSSMILCTTVSTLRYLGCLKVRLQIYPEFMHVIE